MALGFSCEADQLRVFIVALRQFVFLIVALLLVAVVAACESDAEEGPTATPESMAMETPEPVATPEQISAEEEPTVIPESMATETPEAVTEPDQIHAETDREALVVLYNATDGPNWRVWDFHENNWLSDDPIGEWYGVITDVDGRVSIPQLYGFGLNGAIAAELGGLTNLD